MELGFGFAGTFRDDEKVELKAQVQTLTEELAILRKQLVYIDFNEGYPGFSHQAHETNDVLTAEGATTLVMHYNDAITLREEVITKQKVDLDAAKSKLTVTVNVNTDDVRKFINERVEGLLLTKEEVQALDSLLKGWITRPAVQDVLDRIHEVAAQ